MKETNLELPYPYVPNHRAGSTEFLAVCWALSVSMLILVAVGAPIPLWAALAPIGLTLFRALMFDVVRNATHEAIRSAQADARLDEYLSDGITYARENNISKAGLKDRFHEAAREADD